MAIHGKGQIHTPIVIKKGAYIGMGAMLLSGEAGITIGEGATIGAGSVVTKSVAPYSVAVGNPVQVRKKIDENS